jgi:tetratricopeptide (TPR) repeat protein
MEMPRYAFAVGMVLVACNVGSADYVADRRNAMALFDAKRHEEALKAFLKMTVTAQNDYQRSDAFEQAAMSSHHLKREDEAMQLAARIPRFPQARTVRMRLMAERAMWQAIIDEFRNDDISKWPRSTAGEAFYLRGKAYRQMNDLEAARRDLAQAARRNTRVDVFFELAGVCDSLKRDVEAMDAYLNVLRALPDPDGWMFHTAVSARAAILLRNGKHEYALEELDKADAATGYWRVHNLKLRAAVLKAMGRKAEALAAYAQALAVKGIYPVQRSEIEAALKTIGGQ